MFVLHILILLNQVVILGTENAIKFLNIDNTHNIGALKKLILLHLLW